MNTRRLSRRQFLRRTSAAGALLLSGSFLKAQTPLKRTAADQVTLGSTGIKLSRLGMGTGSNSGHVQYELGQDGFRDLVHYAYDQGITYFDCAHNYATFDWIGGAIKGLPREKLFIQSKVWGKPENVLSAIDEHRKIFDTDYVDSMLIHCMTHNGWTDDMKRIMDGFNEAKERKWIRAKGVSCHSLPALRGAVQTGWTEVHLVRVNPKGVFMDGEDENGGMGHHPIQPVLDQLKEMQAKGRGVIGMKIIGNGTFVKPEDRERSIRFAMSRPELNAVVIGFKNRSEIDEAIRRMNSALAES